MLGQFQNVLFLGTIFDSLMFSISTICKFRIRKRDVKRKIKTLLYSILYERQMYQSSFSTLSNQIYPILSGFDPALSSEYPSIQHSFSIFPGTPFINFQPFPLLNYQPMANPHTTSSERSQKTGSKDSEKQPFGKTSTSGSESDQSEGKNVKVEAVPEVGVVIDQKPPIARNKKKRPQTKNLIKNYGKSILTFIIKNSQYRRMVLKELGIPDNKFINVVKEFRDEIHTISGSRYLWQSHPYSKAFRIMSCQYLRKHNLEHIFNSRIQKYGVYLKYQGKMMKCLECPQEFQSIKEF